MLLDSLLSLDLSISHLPHMSNLRLHPLSFSSPATSSPAATPRPNSGELLPFFPDSSIPKREGVWGGRPSTRWAWRFRGFGGSGGGYARSEQGSSMVGAPELAVAATGRWAAAGARAGRCRPIARGGRPCVAEQQKEEDKKCVIKWASDGSHQCLMDKPSVRHLPWRETLSNKGKQ